MSPTVTPRRRAAVLGYPIAHSLSPVLHMAAYAALGLSDWHYGAHEVREEDLADFITGMDETWVGLSLTMPLKRVVLPLLDHVEPLADVVGAVNTVLVQGSGPGRMLAGANTDVAGVVRALREGVGAHATLAGEIRSAAVLGGGATAASTLAALAELGCTTPTVYVRSLGRVGMLMRAAHRMGVEPEYRDIAQAPSEVLRADVVVSTLPGGAADGLAEKIADATMTGTQRPPGVLLDVAYDPRPTALTRVWRSTGGVAVHGERMLLHQAAEQVRLMTGRPAPLEAMDRALYAALDG